MITDLDFVGHLYLLRFDCVRNGVQLSMDFWNFHGCGHNQFNLIIVTKKGTKLPHIGILGIVSCFAFF